MGLFGRDGARLDNLGFILGKTEYHTSEAEIVKKNLVIEE